MRHSIRVEGKHYRLRPVTIGDSAFIVQLRTDPQRSRFIHPTSAALVDQEEWLNGYFERPGDYYFIVEQKETERAEGTIGIYNLDESHRCAEWGRWVLHPNSKGAFESCLLIYRTAFEVLGLNMVYCRTAIENVQVVLFHKALGLVTHEKLPAHFNFGGVSFDAIEQRMRKETWQKNKADLESKLSWVESSNLSRI
ncbi:MAG TPA: GNAT family N-acetyltransferase [Pyrinomonadaceae bacterium]|nr:GNAT family N-acetyltransferase [Pyrinomonadaceae bacterium]